MKKFHFLQKVLLLQCLLFFCCIENSKSQEITQIDWPKYMAQHDLVWDVLPLQWSEGAFLGNGQVGMMIYVSIIDNTIVFHLGRQDVTDHRGAKDKKTSLGVGMNGVMYQFPRLDIGKMILQPVGKIISGTFRQDLWNAEVQATLVTDSGTLQIKAYTPRDRMVNVIEVISTEKNPYKWSFRAGNPSSPRALTHPNQKESKTYVTNPKPLIKKIGSASVCVQSLLEGGDYATAWIEKPVKNKTASTLFVSTANEVPRSGYSEIVALKTINDAANVKLKVITAENRTWWHNYYKQSFITIPDAQMESFYWIQLYRLATSSRTDGPAIDLFGTQYRTSQWPGIWFNLNIQLTYWPVYASNHLEMGESLINMIDDKFDGLLKKMSDVNRGVLGDFAWTMHNYWLQYRYAGDWKSIQNKWVPKAIQIVAAYEKFQITDSVGRIQLLGMGSPEYKGFAKFNNPNYNLALLNWLLSALIESNEKAGINNTDVVKWKEMRSKLLPYPVDENGLMIGSNQPVDETHRCYSHILGLYPLFQLSPDSPKDRELVEKSVLHWHHVGEGKDLCGFSFLGAASLYAALGRGDDAYKLLNGFLNGKTGQSLLTPNTFYLEGKNTTNETPLSFDAAAIELLLQSWGNKIRVFPAIPKKWSETSFSQLRAQGGFLVSASLKEGKTEWIEIKSQAGESCVLKTIDWTTAVQVKGTRKFKISPLGNGEFAIDLKAGEEILLSPRSGFGKAMIAPINHPAAEKNNYGVKKGKNMPGGRDWEIPEYTY